MKHITNISELASRFGNCYRSVYNICHPANTASNKPRKAGEHLARFIELMTDCFMSVGD